MFEPTITGRVVVVAKFCLDELIIGMAVFVGCN